MQQPFPKLTESQALYDICLSIGFIKNMSDEWTPKFNLEIYFEIQNSFDLPSPYQIIQPSKQWSSTINLEGYVAQNIHLAPLQQKKINELCTFRGSMPIQWLQQKQVACCMEVSMNGHSLGIMKYNFDSLLGLSSYLPIFSPQLGFYLHAKIQTQLLGIRCHKKCHDDSNNTLTKAVDFIFQENNRLLRKIKTEENQCPTEVETKQNFSDVQEIQHKSIEESEENVTTSETYRQFWELKNYKQPRIFKDKSTQNFRQSLVSLVERVSHDQSKILQCNWQKYLQFSLKSTTQNLENSRKIFSQDFACQIRNKILRNKGLQTKSTCPLAIGRLKTTMEGFKIVNKTSDYEENSRLGLESINFETPGKHLIVLVHGYGASSLAMIFIERTIKYLYPHIDVLNSKSNQIQQESTNIESMGFNLAIQIQEYMNRYSNTDDIELSFIGYSLGGVVIRAALLHLQIFKFNMNTFISLSCPHIGHIEHENKLAKVGMLAINTIWHSNIIDDLFLKDNKNQRLSKMYSLSCHSGLSWFKNITLYGSANDGYVSENSALINRNVGFCQTNSDIIQQMSNNLNEIMKNSKLLKYEIRFTHETGKKPDLSEFFVGRASHLAFCTNQSFINCFLLQHYKGFKQETFKMDESEI